MTSSAVSTPAVIVLNDRASILGGADKIANLSAQGLARAGLDVTLFCADASEFDQDTARPLKIHALGQLDILRDTNRLRAATQGIWNRPAAQALDGLLSQADPNRTVIHLHSWTKALSSSVIARSVRRGFSVVCTLHDYFLACPTGAFFDFASQDICRRTPLSASCIARNCDVRGYAHKAWRVARQFAQRKVGRLPGAVEDYISVSKFSADLLAPYLPSAARVHLVPNPIDVEARDPTHPSRWEPFLMAGGLHPGKGAALYVDALVRARLPGVCIGVDASFARNQAIPQHVELLPWCAPGALRARMRAARALVFPSLWYETQGLVVLEAAAQGLPAIVPDTSAARDFVEHEKTGLWFRGGDVDALAGAMGRLAREPALADSLGAMAYERYWADPPTLERHVDALKRVYRGILQRRRG